MMARIQPPRLFTNRTGFTLVELLVVIGIIALLISILLPALSKARDQANTIKCLSNVRQLVLASKMFAQDHQGFIPTASDSSYAAAFDPYKQKFNWRNSGGTAVLADWASSLLPYLGLHQSDVDNFQNESTNPTPGWISPRVLICPGDRNQDQAANSGYILVNNVTGASPYNYSTQDFPISYGINADVSCLIDGSGIGRFDPGNDEIVVTGGPGNPGQPLQCRIDRIAFPSQTLLFADCGNKPAAHSGPPLNWNDTLYYTTNGMTGVFNSPTNAYKAYTMQGVAQSGYMGNRIPASLPTSVTGGAAISTNDRHKGRINVAFGDGHAESVAVTDLARVRVSPYR